MVEVPTAGGPILVPVEIRRTRRSRHMRLWLGPNHEAIVSVPWHYGFQAALEFLKSHGDWLDAQMKAQPKLMSMLELLRKQGYLTAEGRAWPLHFELTAGRTTVAL